MEWIMFWLVLSALVGFYANSKGRSVAGAVAISLLLSPLIGFIVVAIMADRQQLDRQSATRTGAAGEWRKCPACAEVVRAEALKCRFCGEALTPVQVASHLRASAASAVQRKPGAADSPSSGNKLLGYGGVCLFFVVLYGALTHSGATESATTADSGWRDSFHAEVSGALARNGPAICAEYKWRAADAGKGEYIVRCGESDYVVTVGDGAVKGPYPAAY